MKWYICFEISAVLLGIGFISSVLQYIITGNGCGLRVTKAAVTIMLVLLIGIIALLWLAAVCMVPVL